MFTKRYNQIFHDSGSFKKIRSFENVQITPELAANLLLLNKKNRPIHANQLKKYKEDMLTGEWKYIGDSIRISRDGVLMDGQHRLLAVVQTNVTIHSNIQTGIDPETFTVMDTGAVRNSSDMAALQGYSYHANVVSVANAVETLKENPNEFGFARRHMSKKRHKETIALLESLDKDLLEQAAAFGHRIRAKAKFLELITVATLFYFLSERGKTEKVTQFFELLATGDGLGSNSNSAVWLLRNKLIENATATTKLTPQAKFSLIVHIWNTFLRGRGLTRLPKITEDCPEISY